MKCFPLCQYQWHMKLHRLFSFSPPIQYLNIKLVDISVPDTDKYPHLVSCFIIVFLAMGVHWRWEVGGETDVWWTQVFANSLV